MKKLLLVVCLLAMVVPIASAGDYADYDPIYLNWHKPNKVVASATIEQDGLYHIVFQAQAVNNTAFVLRPDTVMVSGKLDINGKYIHGWTENIPTERHYAMVTIVKIAYLYVGDTIEIKMRGDCSKTYPTRSVMLLTKKGKFQFDVIKITD
jgi:hypothetical protein